MKRKSHAPAVVSFEAAPTVDAAKPRPKSLRALGAAEPPLLVVVDETTFERQQIFKHDSWAATARYQSRDGRQIVCKFNRKSKMVVIPMGWLGRFLAKREHYFLKTLAGCAGIPRVYDSVQVNGSIANNAVAHDFVPGRPLSLQLSPTRQFFEEVERLLAVLHSHRICYVDLHKQENVIVGDDGKPYLIDFQVSVQLPNWSILQPLYRELCNFDLYHANKHRWLHRQPPDSMECRERPAWVNLHRKITVPLRTLRRKFLVAIGIRRGKGHAATEAAPEIGLRRADAA